MLKCCASSIDNLLIDNHLLKANAQFITLKGITGILTP